MLGAELEWFNWRMLALGVGWRVGTMRLGADVAGHRLGGHCLRPPPRTTSPYSCGSAPLTSAPARPAAPAPSRSLQPEAGARQVPGAGVSAQSPCQGGRGGVRGRRSHGPLGVPHRARTGAKATSGCCKPWSTTTLPGWPPSSSARGCCPPSWTPRASPRECPRPGRGDGSGLATLPLTSHL